jgi:Tol biopolymer transport system component
MAWKDEIEARRKRRRAAPKQAKGRRLITAIALLACGISLAASAQAVPQVFAPGVISGPAHDAAAAFTPDGNTVFFERGNNSSATILVSHRQGDSWSQPTIASFSGEWDDLEPAMAPDGTYLLFISNRPLQKGGKPTDGFYNGQAWPGHGSAIWRVDRTDTGWGEPHPLPPIVNSSTSIYAPGVAANGSVYFMKPDGPKSKFRLFRAQWNGQAFDAPVPLPFSDGGDYNDVDSTVAPDESFIVFGSGRPPAKAMDLFICFKDHGSWGTPIHLGDVVNSPGSDAEARLAPDHRTLYFASDRVAPTTFPTTKESRQHDLDQMNVWNNTLYNIWYVSLDPWLEKHRASAK